MALWGYTWTCARVRPVPLAMGMGLVGGFTCTGQILHDLTLFGFF